MKTNGNDKALESYNIFPIVAWILTFSFAIFVYKITQDLKEIATDLQRQSDILQQQTNKPIEEITDFETGTKNSISTKKQ